MSCYFKPIKGILLLVFLITLSQSSGAQENKSQEAPILGTVSWNELIFQGDKFFKGITVKIDLDSDSNLPGALSIKNENDFGECAESAQYNKLLSVQFLVEGGGQIQNQYVEKIWFGEASALPKKRVRLNDNNPPWIKSYCWQDKGVRRQKTFPGSPDENKRPPTEWTKRNVSFYEYPKEVAECETVSDPSLVFYLLSALEPISQQKPFTICVFGKKQLHQLTITPKKHSSLNVFYKVHSPSQEAVVKEQISPIVFSITEKTYVPEGMKPETFSLLGLHKNIRIYLDQEKRLPVKITGKNNSIGELVLDLREYSK
jgi:hypothetical protein